MKEGFNENSPKIKLEMQEMCSTCDELRKVSDLLCSKCQIYERQIESLGKINDVNGILVQESKQKIAKLNQAVSLLTQQIAEKITENTMLRLGIDVNKGGPVKENNCQLGGNNLTDIDKFLEIKMHTTCEDNTREEETNKDQDVESNSEMETSENSEDVQVLEDGEDEETEASSNEKQLQTCGCIVRDNKGTSGVCGRVFRSILDLTSHFNKDHLTADRNGYYVCSWDGCYRNGEPIKTRPDMLVHFRIHSGERPFRCPIEGCNRTFRQSNALRMHSNTHSRTKYPCLEPGCPKVFSQKAPMMLHYRVRHSGERKGFACPVEGCGKVFDKRSWLRSHSLSHTGEKPHVCPYECGKAYVSASDLRNHMIGHVKNDW